jgi:methionyl-tRNA formyltransferase
MLGTGEFALPTFRALYETRHVVAALVTQPDRSGAGHHRRHVNLLKQLALERGTPVLQPASINAAESLASLRELAPDLLVVAAYGQILSAELLNLPGLGAINVHASLLPRYRGASPVVHAILNADRESGVCIIQVRPQLDAGPILACARAPILPTDTAGSLEERLAELATTLVGPVIEQLACGTSAPIPQDASLASRAPKLRKEQGVIDWNQPAARIDCHVRAMQPWPIASTWFVSEARPPLRLLVLGVRPEPAINDLSPGVLRVVQERILVGCGAGAVELLEVQPEGKRRMAAADFARGYRPRANDRLAALPPIASPPESAHGH